MALTYSPRADVGRSLPEFSLPTVDGKTFSTKGLHQALLVMFICNHCPYVKAVEDRLMELAHKYQSQGIQFLGICSNDVKDHPEDLPENLFKRAQEKNYPFPYAVDEDQKVARAFEAVCTPDLFLFDDKGKLFYRGRVDDSWRDPKKVTRFELMEALQSLINNQPPPDEQIPSMGCSIKWKE